MPAGVAGGVSPRTLEQGNSPQQYPDQLSANTTFLQTGSGGYARVSTALMALNQAQNIANIGSDITALQTDVTTLQGQVATLQGQVATLQAQVAAQQITINSFNYLQTEVSTGTIYLDGRTIYKRSIVLNNALVTALSNFIQAHGIANISYIVNIQAMASTPASPQYPITFLNMATAPTLSTGLSIWADMTNIVVSVGTTALPGYQVIATLWYTATDR